MSLKCTLCPSCTDMYVPQVIFYQCNLSCFPLAITPLAFLPSNIQKNRAFLLSILEAGNLLHGQYESCLLSRYPQNSRKDTHISAARQKNSHKWSALKPSFPSSPNKPQLLRGDSWPIGHSKSRLICKMGNKEVRVDYITRPKHNRWAEISAGMGMTG